MMMRRTGGRVAGCLALSSILFLTGCRSGDADIDAMATDSIAAIAIDSTRGESLEIAALEEDPFHIFALPDTVVANATDRRVPLWLINTSLNPIVVEAAGGAGSVVVDTVDGRDSTLVRIETRAPRVTLEARSLNGANAGTSTVVVTVDTVRVAFPR